MHIGEGISGAIFSEDRKYRYALWRVWDREKPALIFIGFNPSTADEIHDDPTVAKLATDARYLKYGSIYIGNLYALISPQPIDILESPGRAEGEENDRYLEELKHVAGIVVFGWGNVGGHDMVTRTRCGGVLGIFGKPVYCFHITKKGQPAHPLYLLVNELHEYLPSPMFKG